MVVISFLVVLFFALVTPLGVIMVKAVRLGGGQLTELLDDHTLPDEGWWFHHQIRYQMGLGGYGN